MEREHVGPAGWGGKEIIGLVRKIVGVRNLSSEDARPELGMNGVVERE